MYSDCLRRRSVSIPAAVGEGFLTRNFSFRFGTLKGVFGVCAIVLFGYVAWHYTSAAQTNAAREQSKGPAPIPATIQTVQKSDFPVYLNGLGTVQPYTTVT